MIFKTWKRVCTKVFSENDYWSYHIDDYVIDDSLKGEYHYVHTNGSSMVIPIFSENSFVMIEQIRRS